MKKSLIQNKLSKAYLKILLFLISFSCMTFVNKNFKKEKEKDLYEKNKIVNYFEYLLMNDYYLPEKDTINLLIADDEKINFNLFKEEVKLENSNQQIKIDDKDSFKKENNVKIIEYPLQKLKVNIFETFTISLPNTGWYLNKIPKNIELIKKEDYKDNTIFKLKTLSNGEIILTFLRKNLNNDIFYRQVVSVLSSQNENFFEYYNKKETEIKDSKEEHVKEVKEYNESKRIADEFFNTKNYMGAKGLYLKLIDKNDINDININKEIYYKLGIIEKETGNIDKAIDYFNIIIADNKGDKYFFPAAIEILKILKEKRKYNDAIEFYNAKVRQQELNSNFKEDFILLIADLYFLDKKFESAIFEYKRFLSLFPNSKNYDRVLFFLANALENLKINPNFKEAYKIYKKIINEFPESEYYNLSKSRILYLERHFLDIK